MRSQIKAAWDWLPVIVRAIVLGWVLLMIGSTITFLPLLGNLKFHPEIPWAFPMTVAVLAVYGAYFSGWGPPAGTRDVRKRLARASLPSARIWRAAIPAMVFGIIALVALRLLLPSLMSVRSAQQIRRGWSFGGEDFIARLLDRIPGSVSEHHHARERSQTDEQRAEAIISARLKQLGWGKADLGTRRKSDPKKVALARVLRSQTTMSLKWIAQHLEMGSWTHVSNLLRP
jgi:hypothetical protein